MAAWVVHAAFVHLKLEIIGYCMIRGAAVE
jgi:hypothetical protein